MPESNPYKLQPKTAYWKPAVGGVHFSEIVELSKPIPLSATDKIATAGSCFAQHIGRALRDRGATYLDLEPAPAYLSPGEATEHGFNIYSCRYGNIYTVRQLLTIAREATEGFVPSDRIWKINDRYCDAMRPSVDPVGHASAETVIALREHHLKKVRELFTTLDIFVFTLGLTEGWVSTADGTTYPLCPGTAAGEYDSKKYAFKNFSYPEILSDLEEFWRILKLLNPKARIILTVSPVTLAATASDLHVLVANTYSKSTLRAVAGDFCSRHDDAFYFPSFEIITTHVNRGSFFNPDQRTVNEFGVKHVMDHFFKTVSLPDVQGKKEEEEDEAVVCDEGKLEKYAMV
ncbi:GSCFA domain-containing protein [Rhizobium sp. TRM95111]|uniref:GSCFA domain-containing protein n=1 Tax=Rhizobium alarense TaxID=2846851 RepID=UPI001F232135|nr:GSCFA domain-containing protein [Rhizobium alarense]MCF3639878.1 GSCFA domain-containing protein [Rhizobium alarense]